MAFLYSLVSSDETEVIHSKGSQFTIAEIDALITYVVNTLPGTVVLGREFDDLTRSLLFEAPFPSETPQILSTASLDMQCHPESWQRIDSNRPQRNLPETFSVRM